MCALFHGASSPESKQTTAVSFGWPWLGNSSCAHEAESPIQITAPGAFPDVQEPSVELGIKQETVQSKPKLPKKKSVDLLISHYETQEQKSKPPLDTVRRLGTTPSPDLKKRYTSALNSRKPTTSEKLPQHLISHRTIKEEDIRELDKVVCRRAEGSTSTSTGEPPQSSAQQKVPAPQIRISYSSDAVSIIIPEGIKLPIIASIRSSGSFETAIEGPQRSRADSEPLRTSESNLPASRDRDRSASLDPDASPSPEPLSKESAIPVGRRLPLTRSVRHGRIVIKAPLAPQPQSIEVLAQGHLYTPERTSQGATEVTPTKDALGQRESLILPTDVELLPESEGQPISHSEADQSFDPERESAGDPAESEFVNRIASLDSSSEAIVPPTVTKHTGEKQHKPHSRDFAKEETGSIEGRHSSEQSRLVPSIRIQQPSKPSSGMATPPNDANFEPVMSEIANVLPAGVQEVVPKQSSNVTDFATQSTHNSSEPVSTEVAGELPAVVQNVVPGHLSSVADFAIEDDNLPIPSAPDEDPRPNGALSKASTAVLEVPYTTLPTGTLPLPAPSAEASHLEPVVSATPPSSPAAGKGKRVLRRARSVVLRRRVLIVMLGRDLANTTRPQLVALGKAGVPTPAGSAQVDGSTESRVAHQERKRASQAHKLAALEVGATTEREKSPCETCGGRTLIFTKLLEKQRVARDRPELSVLDRRRELKKAIQGMKECNGHTSFTRRGVAQSSGLALAPLNDGQTGHAHGGCETSGGAGRGCDNSGRGGEWCDTTAGEGCPTSGVE